MLKGGWVGEAVYEQNWFLSQFVCSKIESILTVADVPFSGWLCRQTPWISCSTHDLLDHLKTNKQTNKTNVAARLAARALSCTQLSASPQVAGERAPAATLSVPRAKRAPLDAIRVTLSHQSEWSINIFSKIYISILFCFFVQISYWLLICMVCSLQRS